MSTVWSDNQWEPLFEFFHSLAIAANLIGMLTTDVEPITVSVL